MPPGRIVMRPSMYSSDVFGRFAATVMLLLALIGGAALPWVACARASSIPAIAQTARAIDAAGRLVCHQRPERSFSACGYPWPVCGRCAGLYLGAAAGAIVFAFWRVDRVAATTSAWRRRLFVAALPTGVLWVGEFILRLDPGTLVRFLGALPAGTAGAAWLMAIARGDLR
jgi:uncharacterized membrane protein